MSQQVERRAAVRVVRRYKAHITVLACDASPDLAGVSFSCYTRNISIGGVQCCWKRYVPVGSKVQLLVLGREPGVQFKHVGRVIWIAEQSGAEKRYTGGIFITETERRDLLAWKQWVEKMVAQDLKRKPCGIPQERRSRKRSTVYVYR